MIHDANIDRQAVVGRSFDVCVIGAGPAGITLARSAAAAGLDVALMEAGGLEFDSASQECYDGEIVGADYFPLDAARLRFLGGTSNHWGGLCRPLDQVDFVQRPGVPLSGWPIGKADLDPYERQAAEILDLRRPPDSFTNHSPERPEDLYRRIDYRRSAPTRFGEKYQSELAAAPRIHLVLNANMVDLRLGDSLGSVTEARFMSYNSGDPGFTVEARAFALCAGGIENARLLLNASSQLPNGIGNEHDQVGRYFSEHPYLQIGDVVYERPRFRPVRFGPTEAHMIEDRVLNHSIRLVAVEENELFLPKELVRGAFCAAPFHERLSEALLGKVIDCEGKGVAAYWRQRRDPTALEGSVELQMEQALDPESRIKLAESRDRFGLRRVALDWRLSEIDFMTARSAVLNFSVQLARSEIGRVKVRDWLLRDDWQEARESGDLSGSWHHLCTTRMSADPKLGVVDATCRVHGVRNLFIGGSSVFSTPGQTVPTFTIVQLALRLADHIAEVAQG